MNFNEIMFTIKNKPYFEVNVISKHRTIKKFIQLAASTDNGEDFFLVCIELKAAWWKPFTPIISGLKFVCFVDLNNAIPLDITTETKYISTDYLVKEIKVQTVKEDEKKQKNNYKTGLPEKLVVIDYPPTLLYEQLEAHYVQQVLAKPPDKYDGLKKWLPIILIIGAAFIGMQVLGINPMGMIGL